ncbi:SusC/RagA family TonB-linked outer membrane protein [Sphingobacterium oryzagri]|uniref:SusC/RagA family TonB-linked outer membrane protein n=1 Tax=Sphingobacterium oryzagri TaxID=3025669 RepID=A0ABY7WIL8_9SPHI|nr:SusC/RagA family TonB-linked outer membrane protein [Sphingobacterium sp. KACC 22765]WDF69456.1 SusC/RagA family TonB-linked outer membrane protein [Sphingobacterium sp. KACC 22765]
MIKRFTRPFFITKTAGLGIACVLMVAVSTNNLLAHPAIGYGNTVLQQQVNGRVTSTNGPVSGVTVSVQGNPGVSTSTDDEGRFTIPAVNGTVLVFTAVGYTTHTQTVTGSTLAVSLTVADQALEEVVVTGYGAQKRENISASVAVVDQKKLKDTRSPNISNLLQGKAPGVDVVNGSGRPGAQANIRIRGRNSISSSTSPLWVVDGVIMHGMPNINPNDVESISILKDAAATAQYGSRGTNGVVVVTTKRALEEGDGTFSVNLLTGASRFNQGNFRLMNAQQLWDVYQSFNNPTVIPENITADVVNTDYNWLKNGTQAGALNDLSATYVGRTEKTSIFASANYYGEQGSVKGYDYERITGRLNIDHKLADRLTFKPKLNASYTTTENRQHSLYDMYLNMPWDDPYNADGTIKNPVAGGITWYGRDNRNYLYDLQYNYSNQQIFDIQSNLDFSYRISDRFTFESMNNLTYYNSTGMGYSDPQSNAGLSNIGSVSQSSAKRITRFFNQMLKYQESFGKHTVSGFVAYEYSDYVYTSVGATGRGIAPGSEILDNAADFLSMGGTKNDYAFQSGLIQGTYSYDDRYNVQASFRVDGSSRFGRDNRYGSFYALSGAWNVHNEAFFKTDVINRLRLRASYGQVGNIPNALYASYSLYTLDGQYNSQPAATQGQYQNPNVGWETSKDANIGLEIGLLNRFNVSVDAYNKNTDGLLYNVPFPATAGWSNYWLNIGGIRNRGVELAVSAEVFNPESAFQWNLGVNISHNRNRIIALRDGNDINSGLKRFSEGRDIDTWYMRQWAGVNAENGAPLWEVVNNETGEVTTTSNYNQATLQFVGTSTPDYQGGINSMMAYKKFTLAASFAYLKGAYAYNGSRELFDADGAYPSYNQMVFLDGWSRWTPDNPNATHPVAAYNNNSRSNAVSSRYLEDASFIRLRNVTLSYDFGDKIINRLKLKNLNLFVSADNLWTATKFSSLDPESALSPANASPGTEDEGNATSQYPAPKRITFGLNLSF